MSFDKAIAHGKEHRRTYKERGKPGEYDRTCRPHGGRSNNPCPWCEGNRLFRHKRLQERARDLETFKKWPKFL